ncbi:type I methionyl aminopeptidase, partial [bacterium]|nr:type I methionyl aminopeptidase [bacterium]
DYVKPGAVTAELDKIAEDTIREAGARPAFKGYKGNGKVGFPGTLCISIDQEVVHGIPSQRKLKEGQIVGIDAGLELDGWYADMARSFLIGDVSEDVRRLYRVTKEALYKGIDQAIAGNYISDIGGAVQDWVEQHNFSVIRDLVGHGIGSSLHEEPAVPNYRAGNVNEIMLRPGMTIAIEPMVAIGRWKLRTLKDGWTAVTKDGSMTGHFEHTVLITEDKPQILTLMEDSKDPWSLL